MILVYLKFQITNQYQLNIPYIHHARACYIGAVIKGCFIVLIRTLWKYVFNYSSTHIQVQYIPSYFFQLDFHN